MSDLNLTSFNPLYPMRIHPYKELLNDSNVNIMDKVNAVIDYLNQVGKLTNDVVKDWNTVYQWVMNDGLTTDVNNKLEAMLANHEFDPIMNNILTKIGDLTTLQTVDKDTLVHSINDLVTEIGSLSSLQTSDKTSVVNAINENATQLAQSASDIQGRGFNVMNPPSPLVAPKGDGVTDDSSAIQAIINYGGTIYFPAKTFGIGTPLTLTNSACLIGTVLPSTGFTTTFKALSALSQMMTVKNSAGTGAGSGTIQNIVFDGNNKTAIDGLHLGVSGSASGSNMAYSMILKNVQCIHFSGIGCQTYANTYIVRFEDCVFGQSGSGFVWNGGVNSGENISFYGCVFFNNSQYGFYASGTNGFFNFFGCSFDYNNVYGMWLQGGGNHTKCFGCHFEANAQLIYVNTNNIFESFSADYVLGSSTPASTYAIVSAGNVINMTLIGGNMSLQPGTIDMTLATQSCYNTVKRINGCPKSFYRLNDSIFTPTLGTQYQNNTPYTQTNVIPITFNPTSSQTAQLDVKFGSVSNPGIWYSDIEPINGVAGKVRNITLRVPSGWYFIISGTNISIGSTSVSYFE